MFSDRCIEQDHVNAVMEILAGQNVSKSLLPHFRHGVAASAGTGRVKLCSSPHLLQRHFIDRGICASSIRLIQLMSRLKSSPAKGRAEGEDSRKKSVKREKRFLIRIE